MRVTLYQADKPHVREFLGLVGEGIRAAGDLCKYVPADAPIDTEADAIFTWGIRRPEFLSHRLIYTDKGYIRSWFWKRCAVGAYEPTAYVGSLGMPADRRRKFRWNPQPWRQVGDKIILAMSNDWDHDQRALPPVEDYAETLIAELRQHTDREIVFRCKPNRAPRRQVVGATMSTTRELTAELVGVHALVAIGGGSTVTAVLHGVPAVVLGDAPVRSISSTTLAEIENPRLATDGEVERLFNDLAYSQWHVDEFASGEAWNHLRELL